VIDCRAPFFGSFFGEAKKEQPRNKKKQRNKPEQHKELKINQQENSTRKTRRKLSKTINT
jgi:hypothetical protein